jgi:hypothetical protein
VTGGRTAGLLAGVVVECVDVSGVDDEVGDAVLEGALVLGAVARVLEPLAAGGVAWGVTAGGFTALLDCSL